MHLERGRSYRIIIIQNDYRSGRLYTPATKIGHKLRSFSRMTIHVCFVCVFSVCVCVCVSILLAKLSTDGTEL